MDALTTDIKRFYTDSQETNEGKNRRKEIFRRIESMIKEIHSAADVVVIGSSGNGFETSTSDIDVTVVFHGRFSYDNPPGYKMLLDFKEKLEKDKSKYRNIMYVGAANVPIVNFDYCTETTTLPCDISIDKVSNVFNAVLLKAYTENDDRVQPLVIALKKWAKASDIIGARYYKLASFTFTLMVIHYLQSGCYPNVLPSLQKLHPTFFNTSDARKMVKYINDPLPEHVTSFKSTNKQSLGELFVGFFDHYTNFSWFRDGISVREGANIRRPLKRGSNNTCLYVEDPFQLSSNTARACFREYIWKDIKRKFTKAKQMLAQGKSFSELLKN